MAQNQNGFSNRRSSGVTRTYPGTASRQLLAATPLVDGVSPTRGGRVSGATTTSAPTVFRPLSRSQLAPVHGSAFASSSLLNSSSSNEPSSRAPPPPPARPISLDTPRPDSERHRNLYLGAPIPLSSSGGSGGGSAVHSNSVSSSGAVHKDYLDSSVTAAEQVRLPTNSRTSKNKGHSDTISQGVVTNQPKKRTLLDPSGDRGDDSGKSLKLPESSILCPSCRKCRCEACSTLRPLPSRWICSDSIHCGPDPCLDYITCLCCVKAFFYHCGKNHEPDGGVMCADKPCSCAPHRKFWRWGCMTAMSVVLPCLCLYWPCKGCIRVTEKAYQKYHNHGCTCRSREKPLETTISDSEEDHQHHLQRALQQPSNFLPVKRK